ncbi:hypothetical protein DPEC_G00036920 [Dallia pectoralis]|uniref:Uncharacterized protein n=1 Tax=Dallia pectoralis TaxID=75939 RepID=A0ACC2HDT2_DALPE|nr:hypothetical protein DPEC_G00036920 [Dallia pectoralis]
MAPRKKALPDPLPNGLILTDTSKKQWRLGRVIGQGGFGLIYLASDDVDTPVGEDSNYVIKVEPHENGPLFSELKFYQRSAKPETILKWKKKKQLDFLGIPAYWGSGPFEHNGTRYRFMVMDRLGSDLQKVCDRNSGRLKKRTVLQLGRDLLDMLEYIHDNEYVHADIKAANLMLGHTDPDKVYLADYGLSYRYSPDGVHKEYKENPKKGHNGTIEYTSIDAHKGVAPSRRGDMEVLGFCLLHWLCGSLPWNSVLKHPTKVLEAKTSLMDNLPGSVLQLCVGGASTDELASFLLCVKSLRYKDCPDYKKLRELLSELGQKGNPGCGKLDLTQPQGEKACRAKSSSTQTPAVVKETKGEDSGEMEPEKRPKPISSQYIRGPPISKPQKTKPVYIEENAESKEDMNRHRPVPSQYIRGPPISKPQSEQKASTKTEGRAKKTIYETSKPQVNQRRSYPRGSTTPTKRSLGQTHNAFRGDSSRTRLEEHGYFEDLEAFHHERDEQCLVKSQKRGSPDSDHREEESHGAHPSNQNTGWDYPLYISVLVAFIFLILACLFTLTDGPD